MIELRDPSALCQGFASFRIASTPEREAPPLSSPEREAPPLPTLLHVFLSLKGALCRRQGEVAVQGCLGCPWHQRIASGL